MPSAVEMPIGVEKSMDGQGIFLFRLCFAFATHTPRSR